MLRKGDTSRDSTIRFRSLVERHAADSPRPSVRESAAVLDDIIWRHVGHFARRGAAILADVIDDYGSLDERRFWRRLAGLRRRGDVERTPDGFRRRR